MNERFDFVLRVVVIGAGATLLMDVWAAVLRRFGVPSLNFALLGRWVGHLPKGVFFHQNISKSAPVPAERVLGWTAHYLIGVSFSAVLLLTFGSSWAHAPSLLPALAVGIGTVVAPLFVLQPALGLGIASSKTPRPVFNALKSLLTHTVFGFGLFLAANAVNAIFPNVAS